MPVDGVQMSGDGVQMSADGVQIYTYISLIKFRIGQAKNCTCLS